jgi:hypothetical protein
VTYQGFSHALQTQADMLLRLRNDLDRMKADPLGAFAPYDFFVSAFHLSEWPPKASIDPTLLAVLSHLANGAKHFRATNPKHKSVTDMKTSPAVFQPDVFQHDAFGSRSKLSTCSRFSRVSREHSRSLISFSPKPESDKSTSGVDCRSARRRASSCGSSTMSWPQRCGLHLRSWIEKRLSPPPGTFDAVRQPLVGAWKNDGPRDHRG